MGTWLSNIWWGGDPDAVNPTSGLSKREMYAVQKSWAKVYANPVDNGTEILKRFFRAHPKNREFFKMLKKLSSEEDLSQNIQFKAHVVTLMSSFNMAVLNMNQPELVVVLMNKLGASHAKRYIKEEHFQELKEVIVNIFIEMLKLDDYTLGAWAKTLEFWYRHIFETINSPEGSS